MATMLRQDLDAARETWLNEARRDPEEFANREQSDFLAAKNHDGESLDFHALRHTCGAWLAMAGAHPKAIQAVMRHSSITLTMDTYGHLFPSQEAETVARLSNLLGPDQPEALRATGTMDVRAGGSDKPSEKRSGRRSKLPAALCDTVRVRCEHDSESADDGRSHKSKSDAELDNVVRLSAREDENGTAGIRTQNQRIMSPLL